MKKYILSIDAGTTGISILLFDNNAKVVQKVYSEFTQFYPRAGWVEHDANEIWEITLSLIQSIVVNIDVREIAGIGITNQRETTVVWDRKTSNPVYNAIVWQCRRTSDYCNSLDSKYGDLFKEKTGLVMDSYFSGTKINWILNNVADTYSRAEKGQLAFGTIDTWLIWKLTNGKFHVTDHSNASRTLIYNIDTHNWDEQLLEIMNIPPSLLPDIQNSSSEFGMTDQKLFNLDIPICGVAGDQQAALYGQIGFDAGTTKCTYGTGCFMLTNNGSKRLDSKNGLLTTVACNEIGQPTYALEGSVFIGGAVIQWLRDELGLINTADETEAIAESVKDTNTVYIVPAFAGLGAPHWDMSARGTISGITRGTNRAHIIRAGLESIAFQVNDLLTAIQNDLNINISQMNVDGGATANNFLMQFQADISNLTIERPTNIETTALGAALLAGLGSGFWSDPSQFTKFRKINKRFKPKMDCKKDSTYIENWNKAIARTLTIN